MRKENRNQYILNRIPMSKITVEIPESIKNGSYANAVSVNVGQHDVTLDFGLIQPGVKDPTIGVVQRLIITHEVAESFMTILQDAMLDFRNKKKKQ